MKKNLIHIKNLKGITMANHVSAKKESEEMLEWKLLIRPEKTG